MNSIARCSFCHKDGSQVEKLIAGHDVYICNECVGICNDVLNRSSVGVKDPKFIITEQTVYCATLENYDETTIEDMRDWLAANVKASWVNTYDDPKTSNTTYKIIFESESDLVAFKIRWV